MMERVTSLGTCDPLWQTNPMIPPRSGQILPCFQELRQIIRTYAIRKQKTERFQRVENSRSRHMRTTPLQIGGSLSLLKVISGPKSKNKKIPPMDPELKDFCLVFPGNVPDAVESNPTRCETGLRYIYPPVENPFAPDRAV